MALTRRQQILYTDTVDIYIPVASKTSKVANDEEYYLAYSNVKCKWFASIEVEASGSALGRTLQDNMFSYDKFHFSTDEPETKAGYVIYLTTSGIPGTNTYYRAMGNATTVYGGGRRKARMNVVQAKHITKPKIAEDS